MSLRERVKPGVSRRSDFPLMRSKTALLVIDIQKYLSDTDHHYFKQEAFPRTVNNIGKLAQQFRILRDESTAGCEVIFTYLQSATKDGRDISLDYKLSGPALANIPRVGDVDLFCEDCHPDPTTGKWDILLPKTSCSVFQSTNLDYMLRNLGIEQLVITGQLTDQCVESAVRDAADLGYFVTLVEDACAANSSDSHMKGLQSMNGFCRILKTDHVICEITRTSSDSDSLNLALLSSFLTERGFTDAALEVACFCSTKYSLSISKVPSIKTGPEQEKMMGSNESSVEMYSEKDSSGDMFKMPSQEEGIVSVSTFLTSEKDVALGYNRPLDNDTVLVGDLTISKPERDASVATEHHAEASKMIIEPSSVQDKSGRGPSNAVTLDRSDLEKVMGLQENSVKMYAKRDSSGDINKMPSQEDDIVSVSAFLTSEKDVALGYNRPLDNDTVLLGALPRSKPEPDATVFTDDYEETSKIINESSSVQNESRGDPSNAATERSVESSVSTTSLSSAQYRHRQDLGVVGVSNTSVLTTTPSETEYWRSASKRQSAPVDLDDEHDNHLMELGQRNRKDPPADKVDGRSFVVPVFY